MEKETCRNCGTELQGEFCHKCGQSATIVRRPAKELVEDAFSYVFQWDNRLIHTLKSLFFNPGQLSLDWVNGMRMRYVPPFRLYIISSFILFLLIGISPQQGTVEFQDTGLEKSKITEELQNAVAEADANGAWFSAAIIRAVGEAVENPSAYKRKITSNLPKAAFLCLPLFALLHMATEFRKDRYYIDFIVFSLHFHAFAFLLLSIIMVTGLIYKPAGEIAQLLNLAAPVYTVVGLRKFNSQTWMQGILKGILIFGAYSACLIIGLAFYFMLLMFL